MGRCAIAILYSSICILWAAYFLVASPHQQRWEKIPETDVELSHDEIYELALSAFKSHRPDINPSLHEILAFKLCKNTAGWKVDALLKEFPRLKLPLPPANWRQKYVLKHEQERREEMQDKSWGFGLAWPDAVRCLRYLWTAPTVIAALVLLLVNAAAYYFYKSTTVSQQYRYVWLWVVLTTWVILFLVLVQHVLPLPQLLPAQQSEAWFRLVASQSNALLLLCGVALTLLLVMIHSMNRVAAGSPVLLWWTPGANKLWSMLLSIFCTAATIATLVMLSSVPQMPWSELLRPSPSPSNGMKFTVAVVGALRNCEEGLRVTRKVIERISSTSKFFKVTQIILSESNSNDGTVKALEQWKKEEPGMVEFFSTNTTGQRTQRIAAARNWILDFLSKQHPQQKQSPPPSSSGFPPPPPPDYVLVLDMDGPNFHLSSLDTCMDLPAGWTACCANSDLYYDLWALRTVDNWCQLDTINDETEIKRTARFRHIPQQVKPIPVYSCFNGAALYRYVDIRNARYNGDLTCEHVPFHEEVRKNTPNATLFIQPKFFNDGAPHVPGIVQDRIRRKQRVVHRAQAHVERTGLFIALSVSICFEVIFHGYLQRMAMEMMASTSHSAPAQAAAFLACNLLAATALFLGTLSPFNAAVLGTFLQFCFCGAVCQFGGGLLPALVSAASVNAILVSDTVFNQSPFLTQIITGAKD